MTNLILNPATERHRKSGARSLAARSASAESRCCSARLPRARRWMLAAVAGWLALSAQVVSAQLPAGDRYYPLDQNVAPGVAAYWMAMIRGPEPARFQTLRVELPVAAQVTFYSQPGVELVTLPTPAQPAVMVGPVYRFRISEIADRPGVVLYPTVELLDRLHPPPGREAEFPVPIELTDAELDHALQGQLVTKIIYLEQRGRAPVHRGPGLAPTQMIGQTQNGLALADQLGRPMAILRIGGRVPDPQHPEPGFFGPCAPVLIPAAAPLKLGMNGTRANAAGAMLLQEVADK